MLFAIFDPIGLPIFLSLTADFPEKERHRVAARSSMVVFIILIIFAYGGFYLLSLLRITLNYFKIVSGIILLIFAVEYVLGREKHYVREGKPEEIVLFPLATPLLAGPGSISMSCLRLTRLSVL